MRNLSKALLASAVLAAMPVANAATLDVDVDITLPNIIILYAYTDIDLTIAVDQLGPLLDTACTSDNCSVDEGATTGALTTLGMTLDLDIASTVSPTLGTNPTIRLDNSWGVRGIGFSTYNESVTALAGNEVINLAIEDLGAPSLSLQTGYVEFDIDLTNPDADNDGSIEANYTITVTGV